MLLVWLACTGPSGDDSTRPTPVPEPEPGLPPVAEALADRCPDVTPHRRVMPPGDDLHRVTLQAESRCNDGSPPVMYVRAATDDAHASDWVLHLESGGLCKDYEECATRWCGEAIYDAANMSSLWSAETAGGLGIASPDPGNTFAGWNQVEVHYCSSDFWVGQQADVAMDGDRPFRLQFEGHAIIGDALDALFAGAVSDDGVETLPPLLPAGTVLFGGSSAGGFGTMYELGRIVDALPGARVIATPDAVFTPAPETMTADLVEAVAAENERQWNAFFQPLYGAFVDVRCAAAADEPWQCIEMDRLFRAAEVPIVYHHDLYDPSLFAFFEPLGIDLDPFVAAGEGTLRLYGDLPGISVHGSACAEHTSLDNDQVFFAQSVVDAVGGPPGWTLHEVVTVALDGQQVVAVDDASRRGSSCR